MKNLFIGQFCGFVFACVLGTLLHFLYTFTGFLPFAAFAAVNESTFEHMKILFFPMLFFALIQRPFLEKEKSEFWRIKLFGTILSTLSIPVLFYTLSGIFGTLPAWVNVLIFFASAAIGYLVEYYLFEKDTPFNSHLPYFCILLIVAACFILATFFPPRIPLFLDPVTGGYGIV